MRTEGVNCILLSFVIFICLGQPKPKLICMPVNLE